MLLDGEADDKDLHNAFEIIYAEYIDAAQLFATIEFEKYAYITNLEARIEVVKNFAKLQREFLNQFDVPFLPGLRMMHQYGYVLQWDGSKEKFLQALDRMLIMDKRYQTELDKANKDLIELRKKKNKKEHTILQSRREFISMLNRLQQNRFVIDRDKTMIEDLAMMIVDSRDQAEAAKSVNKK